MTCPFCGESCDHTFRVPDGDDGGTRIACESCKGGIDMIREEAPNRGIGQHEEHQAGDDFYREARNYQGGYEV